IIACRTWRLMRLSSNQTAKAATPIVRSAYETVAARYARTGCASFEPLREYVTKRSVTAANATSGKSVSERTQACEQSSDIIVPSTAWGNGTNRLKKRSAAAA